MTEKADRKQDILLALAKMLEHGQGKKITTAALSKEVGVSEAALYRHFPSKAKMFEALIDFSEDTLFTRIRTITSDALPVQEKCARIISLLLTFAERNPGICRVLSGDALLGENPRLLQRVQQLFDRCETQLKQLIRDAEYQEHTRTSVSSGASANLLVNFAEGKIRQYIRSDFTRLPTAQLPDQWQVLSQALFVIDPNLSVQQTAVPGA